MKNSRITFMGKIVAIMILVTVLYSVCLAVDPMEAMKQRFPEVILAYEWDDWSLFVRIPAFWANDKPSCQELAEVIAKYCRVRTGRKVCVHLYYGKGHEIADACEW